MIYVTLCMCAEGCGHRWTQSNGEGVAWAVVVCGRCGTEGRSVPVSGAETVDGVFPNVWCPEWVMMTWFERRGGR